MALQTQHTTYRECRTVLHASYCNSGSRRAQPLLKSLHWLPVPQQIDFKVKLATLAYKIQTTSQPEYLRQLISSHHSGSSMSLRSSTRPLLQAPLHVLEPDTAVVLSVRLYSPFGASYQPQFLKRTCSLSTQDKDAPVYCCL